MLAAAIAERTLGHAVEGTAFLDPLEFILAEHDRQRVLCNTLDAIVANPRHGSGRGNVATVLTYLEEDFPLHLADEEEDLFPRLIRRCTAADPITEIIAVLRREHDQDRLWAEAMTSGLHRIVQARPFEDPEPFFRSALAFTEAHRRHAVWENSVILPLARKRLGPADLVDIGRAMARRRGIAYLG